MSRTLYEMVKQIADEEGLKFNTYIKDWVIELEKNDKVMHIYGFRFSNNSSSVDRILSDKSACYEVLNGSNFPAIEHILISKKEEDFTNRESNSYKLMVSKLEEYGQIVLKNNSDSSGGKSVYKVTNREELEETIDKLSDKRMISLSPFYNIECEYRFIVLDGETMVCYAKERPSVTGDGVKTVDELIKDKYVEFNNHEKIDLEYVPAKDEKYLLSWKHNLIKGSRPVEIKDESIKARLTETARQISKRLNLGFVSIDFAQIGDDFKVIEINSGVLMEKFSEESQEHNNTAKEVYRQAILRKFE